MPVFHLKNNTTAEITIRNAVKSDIAELIALNSKWQKANLPARNTDGYVGALFSQDTLTELIKRDQVVVAYDGLKLAGYYLLNTYSKEGVIGKHTGMVAGMKGKGLLEQKAIVGVGLQVVVDTAYMGSGILKAMFIMLAANVQEKYDFMFGTIAKDNPRSLKAHIKSGFTIPGEEEDFWYILYKL